MLDQQRAPEEILQHIGAMTPQTQSGEVYYGIYEGAQVGLQASTLATLASQKTGLALQPLLTKAAYLQKLATMEPTNASLRAALAFLVRHCGCGLHLRIQKDGELIAFDETHWRPMSTGELDRHLTRCMANEPQIYGTSFGIAREVARIITALVLDDGDLGSDAPPRAVNVRNATLWIDDDGQINATIHRPEHGLRAVLPVDFDPSATCPRYDEMLNAIAAQTTNPFAFIDHLAEIFGFAIQPRRDLPTIVFLWGAGANGKSTLLKILAAMLDRAQYWSGKISTITQDRFMLANLAPCLVAVQDDGEYGETFKTGILKAICENKPMDTRRVAARTGTSFTSTILPIVATNGVPNLDDTSHGLQRRLQVVPFARRFGPDEIIPDLAEQIIRNELPGVLNRWLEGLQRVAQRGRFDPPKECLEARDTFLEEANFLTAFIAERCKQADGKSTPTADLFAAFLGWLKTEGVRAPYGRKAFNSRLQSIGYVLRKSSRMVVDGLVLRQPNDKDDEADPKASAAQAVDQPPAIGDATA